jgi:WD40 repeat protein
MRKTLKTSFLVIMLLPSCYAVCPSSIERHGGDTVPSSTVVDFTTDENAAQIIVSYADGTLLEWDAKSGQHSTVADCLPSVQTLTLSPNRKLLIAGDAEGEINFITLDHQPYPRVSRKFPGGAIDQIIISPDGKLMFVLQRNNLAQWSLLENREIWNRSTSQELTRAALSPDGSSLVISTGKEILIWEAGTGDQIRKFIMPEVDPFISDLAFTSDQRWLVAALDSKLIILDPTSGKRIKSLSTHKEDIAAVTLLNDRQAVTVSDDGITRQWDLRMGTVLWTWKVRLGLVTGNGKYVVEPKEVSNDIEVWDIASQKRLQVLRYKSPLDK